ncbi:MAG: hypothetical protein KDE27_22305 [Planctomycetes bacterium]|nr:hypothetical protein [Planctomycetota bacterium]
MNTDDRCGMALFALAACVSPVAAQGATTDSPAVRPEPIPADVRFDVMKTARDPIAFDMFDFGDEYDAVRAAWIDGDPKRLIAKNPKRVVEFADRWIAAHPRSHVGHGLKYLAWVEIGRNRSEANDTVSAAVKALEQTPEELGLFFNRGVFAHADVGEYQTALMNLVPMLPAGREVAPLRSAHIRALLGCGKGKEAAASNRNLVAEFRNDPAALLDFAKAICESEHGAPMADIARAAIAAVRSVETVDALELDMLEYLILYRFDREFRRARELGQKIAARRRGMSLNNWVWQLMVRRATEGRYEPLALVCAEVMLADDGLSPEGRDTASLALFLNGRLDDAIREQERTYAEYGPGDFVLIRLEMFKALRDARSRKR